MRVAGIAFPECGSGSPGFGPDFATIPGGAHGPQDVPHRSPRRRGSRLGRLHSPATGTRTARHAASAVPPTPKASPTPKAAPPTPRPRRPKPGYASKGIGMPRFDGFGFEQLNSLDLDWFYDWGPDYPPLRPASQPGR